MSILTHPEKRLNGLFHSGSDINIGNYNSAVYDAIVEQAASISVPLEEAVRYIQAERIITEDDAGVIPLFHTMYYTHP